MSSWQKQSLNVGLAISQLLIRVVKQLMQQNCYVSPAFGQGWRRTNVTDAVAPGLAFAPHLQYPCGAVGVKSWALWHGVPAVTQYISSPCNWLWEGSVATSAKQQGRY